MGLLGGLLKHVGFSGVLETFKLYIKVVLLYSKTTVSSHFYVEKVGTAKALDKTSQSLVSALS